jgi:hypothetical protein
MYIYQLITNLYIFRRKSATSHTLILSFTTYFGIQINVHNLATSLHSHRVMHPRSNRMEWRKKQHRNIFIFILRVEQNLWNLEHK